MPVCRREKLNSDQHLKFQKDFVKTEADANLQDHLVSCETWKVIIPIPIKMFCISIRRMTKVETIEVMIMVIL